MTSIRTLSLVPALASCLLLATAAEAGKVYRAAPDTPDVAAKYLIYMHGGYVEKRGSDGTYQYNEILEALAGRGLEVIGKEREQASPRRHANWVRDQIEKLLQSGVPSKNITVSGHSKGGMISMIASTMIESDDIRYAVLASCGLEGSQFNRAYRRFTDRAASRMKGRFIVAWDKSDNITKDCDDAMRAAGVPYRNITFDTGKGHRLFYEPRAIWMDTIEAFAKQE